MEEENLSTPEVVDEEPVEVARETDNDVKEQPAEDIEKLVEERANKLTEERIGKRLAREQKKHEKEIAKYKQLGQIVESGLGVNNIDDAITQTRSFYTDQGVDIPDPSREWEDKVLGKAEAEEISSYGYEEMEAEANRLAQKPLEKMSIRERATFNALCEKLTAHNDEQQLVSQGVDAKILHDEDFMKFRNQFNSSVKVSDIYSMYNKVTGNIREVPASPGSAKTVTPVEQVKDYISPEDFDKLTDEQLSDPKIMAIVDKSRQSWYKE